MHDSRGSPAPSTAPAPDVLSLAQRLRRLWPYFGTEPWVWALALLATLVGALTEPLIPALLQPLLDQGFAQGTLALWLVPLTIVGVFAVRGMAQFSAQYALSRIANGGMLALRQRLFTRLLAADMALFARHSASSLSNTVVYEVQTGATALVQAMISISRDGFTLLALLAYLLYLNWQLTLVVAVVVPGMVAVMRTLSKRLYRITKDSQQATDALAYVVEENVLAHRIVRLHAAQSAQQARFGSLSQRLRQLALKATIASAAMTPLTQILAALALSLVICLALWQSRGAGANAHQVTVGSFAAFIAAMLMLIAPMRRMADVANPLTRGVAALERGLHLLECFAPEQEGIWQPPGGRARGAIALRNVTVQFGAHANGQNAPPPALAHVSLHIDPGEIVALVGASGAGKSTLASLLPRFLAPTSGQVLLDGTPLPDWNVAALRRQFAVVQQHVEMFNDSIAANVALGEAVDTTRLWAALDAAHLAEYVRSLPQGLHSVVGHNATQMSGGQRQRLAIARALYKNAPILILDEATSALDSESERLVQDALARLMQGRTTLVIAHRLSTIEHADRVVVMEQGRIAEQGRHADLLSRGGLYARLHAQTHPAYAAGMPEQKPAGQSAAS